VLFRREPDAEPYDIVDVSVRSQQKPALGDTASGHKSLARNDLAWCGHALVFGQRAELLRITAKKLQSRDGISSPSFLLLA